MSGIVLSIIIDVIVYSSNETMILPECLLQRIPSISNFALQIKGKHDNQIIKVNCHHIKNKEGTNSAIHSDLQLTFYVLFKKLSSRQERIERIGHFRHINSEIISHESRHEFQNTHIRRTCFRCNGTTI
jgi:hypothetical protein